MSKRLDLGIDRIIHEIYTSNYTLFYLEKLTFHAFIISFLFVNVDDPVLIYYEKSA